MKQNNVNNTEDFFYPTRLRCRLNQRLFRSSRSQMFFKIVVFKKLCNSNRKTPALESLFNKVPVLNLQYFYDETPTQVFSFECSEIFKSTYIYFGITSANRCLM